MKRAKIKVGVESVAVQVLNKIGNRCNHNIWVKNSASLIGVMIKRETDPIQGLIKRGIRDGARIKVYAPGAGWIDVMRVGG